MTDVFVSVCVRLRKNNVILVRANSPEQVIRMEGNWYFHPSLIDTNTFQVTDRLYTCPYKGTCNWVDYEKDRLHLPDVAWTYPDTLPDYKQIAGWYGFYPETPYYQTGECE